MFLIAIYSIILWRLFFLTKSAMDANFYFNGLIILTFALIFFIQTILNIFVNIGVVPTKGLALPFVSYGRSSVIMNFIALAIMLKLAGNLEITLDEKIAIFAAGTGGHIFPALSIANEFSKEDILFLPQIEMLKKNFQSKWIQCKTSESFWI